MKRVFKRQNRSPALAVFVEAVFSRKLYGAFIRFRSALKSRRELFDVGIAGPIAGFLFVLPALALGLAWSRVVPGLGEGAETRMGLPLLIQWLGAWVFPGAHVADLNLHPVARAAWVGLLATALK